MKKHTNPSRTFTYLQIGLIVLLLCTFIAGTLLVQNSYGNAHIEFLKVTPEEGTLFRKLVYISGGVKTPGVYEVEDDTRIIELIEIAGGLTDEANGTTLAEEMNLSKRLEDEEHIYIPTIAQAVAAQYTDDPPTQSSNSGLVSLNSATKSELETLPGVGPSTADKIIMSRPYSTTEDIKKVSGIGEATFEKIRELITI